MEASFAQSLIIAAFVGFASGSIGSFVLLRRMALVSDALSHVALPGIALALAYSINPFFAVLLFLAMAAFFVWWLETKTKLPAEALVGLLFTTSLALGILMISKEELVESLFGAFPDLPFILLATFIFAAAAVSFAVFALTRSFSFMIISPDLAAVAGIGKRYNLFLLLIFSIAVALGIKLVGTLLMGALTIISALIAKNITHSMRSYIIISSLLGGVIAVGGIFLSRLSGYLPGPTVILFGVILFICSLPFAGRNRKAVLTK